MGTCGLVHATGPSNITLFVFVCTPRHIQEVGDLWTCRSGIIGHYFKLVMFWTTLRVKKRHSYDWFSLVFDLKLVAIFI